MIMMLSVIMVTAIFAGMKLEVRAAKNYSFDLVSPGSFAFALQNTYYSFTYFIAACHVCMCIS